MASSTNIRLLPRGQRFLIIFGIVFLLGIIGWGIKSYFDSAAVAKQRTFAEWKRQRTHILDCLETKLDGIEDDGLRDRATRTLRAMHDELAIFSASSSEEVIRGYTENLELQVANLQKNYQIETASCI